MARLLVIDTETGGIDPLKCSLLSIGAVVWEDGQILDQLEIYVREREIVADSEAMAINCIDLDWLKGSGQTPSDAVASLRSLLNRHFGGGSPRKVTLGGHNIGFDVGFLKRLYRLAAEDYAADFSHRVLDTSSMVGLLILAGRLPIEVASSNNSFRHFGIEVAKGQRHKALADAVATATLLNRLIGLVCKN
jgi:DNA polymerase-3 subunit epsilon